MILAGVIQITFRSVVNLNFAFPMSAYIYFSTSNFQYNSWRVFVALCALPSFLVAIALLR